MKPINSLTSEIKDILKLSKLFFNLKQSYNKEIGSPLSRKPLLYFIFSLIFPLISFPIYAIFIVGLIIPQNPESPSLKIYFGSGFTLVSFFFVILLFVFSIARFSDIETFFRYPPFSEIINSSPIPLPKLLISLVLSSFLNFEYWFSLSMVSVYIVYHFIVNLPINIIDIFLLIIFSSTISFTGALIGVVLRFNLFDNLKKSFSSKIFLIISSVIILSLLALVYDILVKQVILQLYTPLGWLTMGVYSIISGNFPEYRLTIFISLLFLLISLLVLPKSYFAENSKKNSTITYSSGIFEKNIKKLICIPFFGSIKQLAEILFTEDWKNRKPFKFLLFSIIILITLIISQKVSLFTFTPEYSIFNPFISFTSSMLLIITPFIHREIGVCFFNPDGRFMFFKSTPRGIKSITILQLFFIFSYAVPLLLISGIAALLIYQSWSIFIWIPFSFCIGLLVIGLDFLVQCIRLRYYSPNLMFQLNELFIVLIIIGLIFPYITLLGTFVTLQFSELLTGIILTFGAIIISVLSISVGIKKLDKEEILI